MVKLVRVVCGCNGFRCHFSASDPVDDFKLFVCELDIFHIELISDGPPPVLILGLLDELFDFIASFSLINFLEFVVIAEMLELIIPAVRNLTDFDLYLLILLVIRLVVADLDFFLLLCRPFIGTGSF